MTKDNIDEIEEMTEEQIAEAMEMTGLDREDVLTMNVLGQKVRNFALENASEGDKVSLKQIAIAAIATKMAGSWMEMVVQIESGLEDEDAA